MSEFPAVWFAGASPEEKEALVNLLQNNSTLLNRFCKILSDYEEMLTDKELSAEHFDKPEWQVRQAYYAGKKKQLRDIRRLFPHIT